MVVDILKKKKNHKRKIRFWVELRYYYNEYYCHKTILKKIIAKYNILSENVKILDQYFFLKEINIMQIINLDEKTLNGYKKCRDPLFSIFLILVRVTYV